MTAIFMVWNEAGLALAADESLSITDLDTDGKPRTLWTDTAEKIFEVKGHKIAVASAGSESINSIPIMGLLARWENELTTSLPNTQDYVFHFLNFLQESNLPFTWQYRQGLENRVMPLLRLFKQEWEANPGTIEANISHLIATWEAVEPKNLFGDALDQTNSISDNNDDSPVQMTNNFLRTWASKDPDPEGISLAMGIIEQVFDQAFKSVFEVDLDNSISWQSVLKRKLISYLFNYIDNEQTTRLLFVGYGERDWTPTAIKINLQPFEGRLPRADIKTITTPKYVWYEDLAQSDQVVMFLSGIDGSYKRDVLESVPSEGKETLVAKMKEIENERLIRMRSKVKQLSIQKLEFVARSFVEMESLRSFLVEYLPSVGGNIKVISIIR